VDACFVVSDVELDTLPLPNERTEDGFFLHWSQEFVVREKLMVSTSPQPSSFRVERTLFLFLSFLLFLNLLQNDATITYFFSVLGVF